MNITEKFIKATITRITRNVGHEEDELRKILATDLTHEGKRYALKIVELDAELPKAITQQIPLIKSILDELGWVKGVSE